jgi:hypothetical protein
MCHAYPARWHASPAAVATTAAIVFVLVLVFEFVSVFDWRARPADVGSRDVARAPRESKTENRKPLAPHELELEHGLELEHAHEKRAPTFIGSDPGHCHLSTGFGG